MSAPASMARAGLARLAPPTMVDQTELARPTVVVAPHPDDETLGCGGTIARLSGVGIAVGIVFATDGAAAHRNRIDAEVLAAWREDEAVAAAAALGVERGALRFCRVADGTLRADDASVGSALIDLVGAIDATRLLLPSPLEPPSDHVNAGRSARDGLAKTSLGPTVEVWEYGVWAWDHWPWVEGSGRSFWVQSVRARAGLTAARTFSIGVDVSAHLDAKRSALACHRTQMGTHPEATDWPTLGGVRGGSWLDALMGPVERFHRADPAPTG